VIAVEVRDCSPSPVILECRGDHVTLAGRPLFTGTESQLLDRLGALATAGRVALVMTPNVDQTLDLDSSASLRDAFDNADLRTVDGMPLVLLARLLGAKGAQRNTGADLLPVLASQSAARRWRIVVTGSSDAASTSAIQRLQEQFPGAMISAVGFPRIADVSDPVSQSVITQLKRIKPDFVFVCLGAPKQEAWVRRWRDELPPAVYIGAGAAVDFAAGEVSRAPRVVQALSMEWAWRLAREPRRLFRRYLVKGPRFVDVIVNSIRNHTKAAETPPTDNTRTESKNQ
jgi:N-acetylglucosaminyldiphosphoundecaprenol N-acetyl-beta-D-mannosaminyltransferase